jgi:hypothetical protein
MDTENVKQLATDLTEPQPIVVVTKNADARSLDSGPKEAAKNAGAEELKAVRQAAERESEGNSVQGEFWASFAGTENAKREQPVAENPVGRDPALGPVFRRILHGLTDELIAKS